MKSRPRSHSANSTDIRQGTAITIHPQLRNDCLIVGRFRLNHLLLMNDSSYPWFILVPDRENITEIHQLDMTDQQQLIAESSMLSKLLSERFKADKINIAALGNVVPQLHIHHIARYRTDAAWPAPIWGKHPPKPYAEPAAQEVIDRIRPGLTRDFEFLQ